MITQVVFKGAATLRRTQLKLDYFEQQDDRMKHICLWPFHMDHFGESNRSFYKSYAAIQDKNRLAIPAKFLSDHPMHTYDTALIIHQEHQVCLMAKIWMLKKVKTLYSRYSISVKHLYGSTFCSVLNICNLIKQPGSYVCLMLVKKQLG